MYCIKTSSKRTYTRVKTQSLTILSCLSLSPHISWSDFLSDLSSIPSAYRKDAPVPSSIPLLACLVLRENRGSPLRRVFFGGLFFVPAFLLRSQQLAQSVLRSPEIPAVRCAAIQLLVQLPAVLLSVPCEEVSFPAALQEAMATLKTAGMQEAAMAAGNVAEMLSQFVARNSEKPRGRRDEPTEGVSSVSSGGISVETAVQWLMTRLQHCGEEPRG